MARIAMIVPAWIGHLNPMTTLARELENRGHDISILSFADAAGRIQKAGLKHQVIGSATFPPGDWDRRSREVSTLQRLGAARYTMRWLRDMVHVMLNELPSTLAASNFDGVIMDQVCWGAETTVQEFDRPLAVAQCALPIDYQPDIPVSSETWPYSTSRLALLRNRCAQQLTVILARSFLNQIRRRRAGRGQSWNVWHYLNELPPSLALVAQLPACLDFPRRHAPDHFHHTGPWHHPANHDSSGFDWTWLDDRPLIYASLGTLQNGLDHVYQTIMDACSSLPVQLVVGLGRQDGKHPEHVPPNARVLAYAPQLPLLQRASLVITHAGMNTTLEALTQGLPIIALPIAHEQPGIASRIQHAGVGEWLSIRRLTPGRLRAAILRVQQNPSCRERARACAAQIAEQNGVQRAASILEEAIVERCRIVRANATQSADALASLGL